MSTVPMPRRVVGNGYPTTDGKPMAETDLHRDLMVTLIDTLRAFYRDEPMVYVSGNLLLFYEESNRRRKKHSSRESASTAFSPHQHHHRRSRRRAGRTRLARLARRRRACAGRAQD